MNKIFLIDKCRDELNIITLKQKRLKNALEYLNTLILPKETEIKINNTIIQALEELDFFEKELKRDLGVMVYNG